jgi:hypothetical protein
MSDVCRKFFYYDIFNNNRGPAYLTALSFSHNEQSAFLINDEDANLHFSIAKLCFNITRSSRVLLATVFEQLCSKIKNSLLSNSSSINDSVGVSNAFVLRTAIPTSVSTIRSQFLEGRYAYIPNIPIPDSEMIGQYIYVSLKSVVAYIMAIGIPIVSLQKTCQLSDNIRFLPHSKKCQLLLENALMSGAVYDIISFVTEWSDSFDPNTSTKNNRGSVYVKSISFAKPENSTWPISCYTYPICIGPSKGDKSAVEDRLVQELDSFKQSTPLCFLDGSSKSMKSIYIDLLCSIQDQPERRSLMKKNRGSVYVKSISFAKPENSPWPISFYTYPICIGPSKGDKSAVEDRLVQELDSFKQ